MATTVNDQMLIEEGMRTDAVRAELDSEESELINNDQEVNYANQLAIEQELYSAQQEAEAMYQEAQSYKSPSLIKYGFLGTLALANDLVDLFEFTGVGITVSWIVSQFLSASIVLIYWFTDTKQKNAMNYVQNLQSRSVEIADRLSQLEQRAMKTSKAIGRLPGLSNVSSSLTSGIDKLGNRLRESGIGTLFGGIGFELIPGIDIMPWSLISVILTYFQEKNQYKQVQKEAEEVYSQFSQNNPEIV